MLTFDDASKSHYTVARPLLLKYKFGATFFVTEGFDFPTNKKDYMTWDEIAQLHKDGFEIGNHTLDHKGVTDKTLRDLPAQVRGDQRPVQGARHPAAGQLRLPRQRHRQGRAAGAQGPRHQVRPPRRQPRSTRTRRAAGSPTSRASTTRCSSPRPATPARPGRSTTSRPPSRRRGTARSRCCSSTACPDTAHDWVNTKQGAVRGVHEVPRGREVHRDRPARPGEVRRSRRRARATRSA